MADCIILGSGSGGESGDCTADRSKVLASYTAVTRDSNDDPAEGTMPNNGDLSATLAAGQSKTIPAGYTSGGTVTAKDLTSQTKGTVDAAHMVKGYSGYANGKEISGAIEDRGPFQYARGIGEAGDYYAFNNMPNGWYHESGEDSSWAPEVRLAKSTVRNYLGIAASKIISGQSIAGVAGNQHPYGYVVGDVTSDSGAAFYDGTNYYMCRFNLPFEPMVGYVIHYHSNRMRDITVFAPDNRGAKSGRMMNFNQARLGGSYSYAFAQNEQGAWCGRGNCIIPVAYGGSTYQYFFAGHY